MVRRALLWNTNSPLKPGNALQRIHTTLSPARGSPGIAEPKLISSNATPKPLTLCVKSMDLAVPVKDAPTGVVQMDACRSVFASSGEFCGNGEVGKTPCYAWSLAGVDCKVHCWIEDTRLQPIKLKPNGSPKNFLKTTYLQNVKMLPFFSNRHGERTVVGITK